MAVKTSTAFKLTLFKKSFALDSNNCSNVAVSTNAFGSSSQIVTKDEGKISSRTSFQNSLTYEKTNKQVHIQRVLAIESMKLFTVNNNKRLMYLLLHRKQIS